jgi:hypothetical protein
MPVRALAGLLLSILLATTIGAVTVAAATHTVYVDGKHGSDTNAGTSSGAPLKTVKAGLWLVRYGGTLNVVGYDDYVYYEQTTQSQWFINGTSTSPIVIQAAGYDSGNYVRPIISGAKVVSRPGDGKWTRPDPVRYPNVWQTPWTTPIPGYESAVNVYRQERVFVDVSQPLIRPTRVPTLANLQALPGAQYWNGSKLYVRLGGWGSTSGASLDPNEHTIEVPYYKGILVSSGSAYVQVKGFRIRHTTMAVGFTGDSHHNLAQDIDASYNYTMGFWTGGDYHTFRRITGTRNTLQLVKLDNGAGHNLVEEAVATQSMGQGIKITGASTSYNTVRRSVFSGGKDVPVSHGQYGGYVQGIDIEQGAHHNSVYGNLIERNRRGLMLYQMNSSGKALTGNVIKSNTFTGNDVAVVLWDGKFNSTQGSGIVTFSRNTYTRNRTGVMSEAWTTNKTFDHETFYATGTSKTVSHSSVYLKAGYIVVKNSIFRSATGYHFYTKTGSKVKVYYSIVRYASLGARNSSTRVVWGSGIRNIEPGFLSTSATSPDYLYIGPSSAAYKLSSTKGPLGARWR